MQTFLKVTNVEVTRNGKQLVDKNGRPFQVITFTEVGFLNNQEILTGKSRTRNLWSTTPDQKGDNLYNQLQVGSMVAGSIQSFNTTPFSVNDRTVSKTTVVVFDFENPVSYANSQLKRNGACVVNEHGQPTATFNLPKADPTEVEEEEEVEAAVELDLNF